MNEALSRHIRRCASWGKSGTEGRGAGRRVFGYIKTSPDIQRTRCVTEKNHVAHPRSRIKKYPGRAIRNPPFEGESEEMERSRIKKSRQLRDGKFPGLRVLVATAGVLAR